MIRKNLIFTAAIITMGAWSAVNAQTKFPTGTKVAITKPGNNSAPINYTIYTSTSDAGATFTAGNAVSSTYNLNGIGLNPADSLVYATAFTGQSNNASTMFNISLMRIGADGTMINLGVLPGSGQAGPGGVEFVNLSAGTVSNNVFTYTTYSIKPSAMARISPMIFGGGQPDLTAADIQMFVCWKSGISSLAPAALTGSVATGYYEIDFSNTDVTSAINAFLAQVNSNYPDVFNADGGIQDIAISPVDGKTYGYMSYPSAGNIVGRPVVLSTPVGLTTIASPVGSTINAAPNQEADGVMFGLDNNYYVLFNTGDYAQVNMTTGALMNLTATNIPTTIVSGSPNLRGDLASPMPLIPTPLPLELISFSGRNNGVTNELSWITATEMNNRDFTIERSQDLKSWIAIGVQASKAKNGNSSEKLYYTFTDNMPHSGTAYYRLKQVDRDNKVTYSKDVSIKVQADQQASLYPNPAGNSIRVDGLTVGNTIRIVDITGKTVLTEQAANTAVTINLSGLTPNMYLVQITDNGTLLHSAKLIKK